LEFSAKTLWPLFPLLLLVVVVCLTWAFVAAVRGRKGPYLMGYQAGALFLYILTAVSAMASEGGGLSVNIHRPFSILTQVMLALALYQSWKMGDRKMIGLNIIGWGAILADTALHFLLVR
jgi:hypothetical protein